MKKTSVVEGPRETGAAAAKVRRRQGLTTAGRELAGGIFGKVLQTMSLRKT